MQLGRGAPWWRIRASGHGLRYLGEQIDLHGGVVRMFPHHENEIAQSER